MFQLETLLRWLEAILRVRGVRREELRMDGAHVSYHVGGRAGAAPAVVLVHGLGSNSLTWVKVLAPLARRGRVYAPDLPGYGHSPMPPGKDHAPIQDQVDAIVRFIESVAERPVVLVGQSMGGWVCAKVAAKRPDLVSRLVLCNNAGVLYPEIEDLRHVLDLKSADEVREFWSTLWHEVPGFYRYFRADYVSKMQAPRIRSFFDSLKEEDFINGDLPRLTMPVAILWGMSDRFIPATTVDLMLGLLHNARVYWIPRCGHIPALERPREFLQIMRRLLEDEARHVGSAEPVAVSADA